MEYHNEDGTPNENWHQLMADLRKSVQTDCVGVWHITTPREHSCPMCGEDGPQMLGRYATAEIIELSLVTWWVEVRCSDPRVLLFQDYTASTFKVWGTFKRACRQASAALIGMEKWAEERIAEND